MCDGCGTKIVQLILFVVNFLVWVTGVILVGVGAYALVEAGKYSVLFGDENNLQAVAGFMLGVGVIILIIGFCGCCGAFKKSECLLKIYFALVLLVIILEVIAGILAFVYQNEVEQALEDNMGKIIREEYNDDPNNVFTKAIDEVQEAFQCCGYNGSSDWAASNYTQVTGKIPDSCCENQDSCTEATAYPGCRDAIVDWVVSNYLMVGGVCIGLLVFEILALIFACCLIKAAADEEKGL